MKLYRGPDGQDYGVLVIRDSTNKDGAFAIIADIMGEAQLCCYGFSEAEATEYLEKRGIKQLPAKAIIMQNMIEIRHFVCPKCQRGENHFIFPTAQAVAIECPDCFSRYWWAHHKGKLYDDMTRAQVDDAHFMLLDYTPVPEETPEEKV